MTLHNDLRQAGHQELADSAVRVEEFVGRWWEGGALLPWFTDHGPAHSKRVADYSLQIAEIPDLPERQKLTLVERYILYSAAWLHDLGMQSLLGQPAGTLVPADYDRIRHEHPMESRRIILDKASSIGLPDDDALIGMISLIARGHGTKYFLDSAQQLTQATHVRGEAVRGPLLTAILLMGDEMDLDARRVKPMPAEQPMNLVSQAHATKHRRVVASGIEHGPQCRVGLSVRLEESPGGEAQAHELEVWIVEKLRMQLAMVDSVFTAGFGGAAELDRAISIGYQPCIGNGTPISPDVAAFIEDQNRATQLIDHRVMTERALGVIRRHGTAIITGRLNGWEDVDGREDILSAVMAQARSDNRFTAESHVLYETAGGASLKDVLFDLVAALRLPASNEGGIEDLANELLTFVRSRTKSFVVAISSVDYLAPIQQAWLQQHLAQPLNDLANAALILTAKAGSEVATWDALEQIDSYGMDAREVEWYLRRYTGARPAKVEAQQSLRYSRYKALRQSYLAEMAGF